MDKEAKKPVKAGRLMRIALVCSLGLNFAVAGIVGGALLSGRAGDGPPRSFDLGISPIARALTAQERRDVASSLRRDRVMQGADLRARANAMVSALTAVPYDPEILRDLLQQQSTQIAAVQAKAQEAFLDAITDMTPERRASFANQLENELSKERPRRGTRQSGG